MKTDPAIKNCVCGSHANVKVTTGGPCFYYAVHCAGCDRDSRGTGNILPQLFSTPSRNAPQTSKEEAVRTWNSMLAELTKEGE